VRITVNTPGSGTVEFFNDVGDQGGSVLGRVSAPGGRITADVGADLAQNFTATFTDSNGNTSAFAFFGGPTTGGSGGGGTGSAMTDSDQDGISDAIEALAGTSSSDAAQKPVALSGSLKSSSTAINLNFATSGKDALKIILKAAMPEGANLAGTPVGILVGDTGTKFTLDAKGGAVNGSAKLRVQTRNGVTSFLLTVRNGNLKDGLSSSGLTNQTTSKTGDPKTIPIGLTVSVAGTVYYSAAMQTVTYKATQGKTGKAK